jgi:acylpyruvate hydrolase
LFFDKPLTSIMKSGEVLYLHRNNEIHHEIELGLLIGMTGKNILARDWYAYIEGYFLGIDFTDRDMQTTAKRIGGPWTLSKGQDGFFAVSGFVDKDKVIDPHNLDLKLTVNSKTVQSDNTKNMIT